MKDAIIERFIKELDNINNYVSYIEDNFYQRSCSVVRTQGYENLGVLKEYVFYSDDIKDKENNNIIIKKLIEIVNCNIMMLENKLSKMNKVELPSICERIEQNDLVDSLVGYIKSDVIDCMANPTQKEYYELIDEINPTDLKTNIDNLEENESEKFYDVLIEDDYANMIDYVKSMLFNEAIDEAERELEEYNELKTLYSIFDDNNLINIYRQAFIFLITAFDATVFDLFTDILEHDFFNLAKYISYDKKFTLGDLTQHQNFDEFITKSIQPMLSGKYVS